MRKPSIPSATAAGPSRSLPLLVILLGTALLALFHRSFYPHEVLFANDGPLGAMMADAERMSQAITGFWHDLYWVGGESPTPAPDFSSVLAMFGSPVIFLKFYTPLALFLAGFSVWLFFRELGFGPMVQVFGGLAAGLNMLFVSDACWGLASRSLTVATMFFAMAALVTRRIRFVWAKALVCGLAVGFGLMEGFDIGAILSLYTGLFIFFVIWNSEGGLPQKVTRSIWMPTVVVLFSAFVAYHTINTLVLTQIKGIAGTAQTAEAKQDHWNLATQGSLPKLETLRILVPGAFGYRMSSLIHSPDKSSAYWGSVGGDPDTGRGAWSGSGEYGGILVLVLAMFGLASASRLGGGPYSPAERRAVWFWTWIGLISLLLALGRFGFLYQFFYQLPYLSTIRNPIKFIYPFHIALIILAGYGLEGLHRKYVQNGPGRTAILPGHLRSWWKRAVGFEERWTVGSLIVLGACAVASLIVLACKADLLRCLADRGVPEGEAAGVVLFIFKEVGLFIFWLAVSLGVVICAVSGAWSVRQSRWFWGFLMAILIIDLGRSDLPWIYYFDYNREYASNPVFDFLRDKPYEHRVTFRMAPLGGATLARDAAFSQACFYMLQNQFPYYNIQALDIVQLPRAPEFDMAYMGTFQPERTNAKEYYLLTRLWRLTNTRYILGEIPFLDQLNQLDPGHSVRPVLRYDLISKLGNSTLYTAEDFDFEGDNKGEYSVFEMADALPRVKLYATWQTPANDPAALSLLRAPDFDIEKNLLISADTSITPSAATNASDPGSVSITDYHPKRITVQADAKTQCVLLYNDRFSPNWKVWVDAQPSSLLRCNYMMRGVLLAPGNHKIEFRYLPPLKPLYITLCALACAAVLAGFLIWDARRRKPDETTGGSLEM